MNISEVDAVRRAPLFRIRPRDYLFPGLLCVFMLIVGVIFGIQGVQYVDLASRQQLMGFLDSFLYMAGQNALSAAATLQAELWQTLLWGLLIWASGFVLLGLPVTYALVFFKGYSLGYTASFLLHNMGASAMTLLLGGMLPQNFLVLPVFLAMAAAASHNSLQFFRQRWLDKRGGPMGKTILEYSILMLILILLLLLLTWATIALLTPLISWLIRLMPR